MIIKNVPGYGRTNDIPKAQNLAEVISQVTGNPTTDLALPTAEAPIQFVVLPTNMKLVSIYLSFLANPEIFFPKDTKNPILEKVNIYKIKQSILGIAEDLELTELADTLNKAGVSASNEDVYSDMIALNTEIAKIRREYQFVIFDDMFRNLAIASSVFSLQVGIWILNNTENVLIKDATLINPNRDTRMEYRVWSHACDELHKVVRNLFELDAINAQTAGYVLKHIEDFRVQQRKYAVTRLQKTKAFIDLKRPDIPLAELFVLHQDIKRLNLPNNDAVAGNTTYIGDIGSDHENNCTRVTPTVLGAMGGACGVKAPGALVGDADNPRQRNIIDNIKKALPGCADMTFTVCDGAQVTLNDVFAAAQTSLQEGQSAALRYNYRGRTSGHVTCLHKLNGRVFLVEGQAAEVIYQHTDGKFYSSTCDGKNVTLYEHSCSNQYNFEACKVPLIPLGDDGQTKSWFAAVVDIQSVIHDSPSASNAQHL